jgi:transcription initiation factor TFIIH subunit 4
MIERWDSAIQMIGDPTGRLGDRKYNPDLVLVQIALEEGLLTSTKKKKVEASDCTLTREGFMFLLADSHEQLWALLAGYFKLRMSRGKMTGAELAASLAFVCRLGLAEACRPAPAASAPSKELLQLCATLGLVVIQGSNFFVSLHAKHLSPRTLADEGAQGFIVLENNFRVYAYTQSLLHIRILSMFVRLEYRLPNLVVGTITRKSALRALLHYGVSSARLLQYLRTNAHARLRLRSPVVPDAVSDQLRAWEAENIRLTTHDGVLFEQFPSREAHEYAVRVAQSRGVLIWSKPWRPGLLDGFVFVTREGVEPLSAALNSISL